MAIFLSAFLVFQIQPIVARLILPAFGGTSTVWTTCMMFFQVALLLGYAYAHVLRVCLKPRHAWLVHSVAALVGLALIQFSWMGVPPESNSMSWSVVKQLGMSIGLPFVVLSATSPLVQAWHAVSEKGNTYRLYAYSNAGSLLALISYPFLVERFGLSIQTSAWQAGFVAYVALIVASGFRVFRSDSWNDETNSQIQESTSKPGTAPTNSNTWRETSLFDQSLWFTFAALASVLLIATSNILCQEMASFPLLWILPLTLYLLSLIVCFERPVWYHRSVFQIAFAVSIFAAILLFHLGTRSGLVFQIVGFASVLFFGSMICHGELYRLRPATQNLTKFYLLLSFGGAVGGVFAVIIAPLLFNGFFEFHLALILILVVSVISAGNDSARLQGSKQSNRISYGNFFVSMIAASPVFCSLLFFFQPELQPGLIFKQRNEYGIVSVQEDDDYRKMFNGQTNHGGQFLTAEKRLTPSAYYSEGSGAHVAFSLARESIPHNENDGLDVAVIGLGTGSMLAYAELDDRFRFFEINPLSELAARKYFSFLDEFPKTEVIIGDGRLCLNDAIVNGTEQNLDLLFVDAFSSDSIPVHLLTAECVDLYLKSLKPNGVLIFHITNKYVDLMPIIQAHVESKGLTPVLIHHSDLDFDIETKWVLLSVSNEMVNDPLVQKYSTPWPAGINPIHWTDDSCSLTPVVKWSNQLRLNGFSQKTQNER